MEKTLIDQNELTLVTGPTGVIGTALSKELCDNGHQVLAAMFEDKAPVGFDPRMRQECGVDVRDLDGISNLFAKYSNIQTVWHLAAALSVETAQHPEAARAVSVGGMKNILQAMKEHPSARCIMFSDSIGSFGPEAPREDAKASWLLNYPDQDPGSAYGHQKKECRHLLQEATRQSDFDTRFAVIPGVLHTNPHWGKGTTEYVLDAIRAAISGTIFANPVPHGAVLPMIHISDLARGLVSLQMADRSDLKEPGAGYTFSGFSFAPEDLFERLVQQGFNPQWTDVSEGSLQAKLANTWPNSIDSCVAKRDLGFCAEKGFEETIDEIVQAHKKAF